VPRFIDTPTRVEAAGSKPKLIDEFVATPEGRGAHYVAVCLPAFSADTVHRDGA
jgi:hypothetical protein